MNPKKSWRGKSERKLVTLTNLQDSGHNIAHLCSPDVSNSSYLSFEAHSVTILPLCKKLSLRGVFLYSSAKLAPVTTPSPLKAPVSLSLAPPAPLCLLSAWCLIWLWQISFLHSYLLLVSFLILHSGKPRCPSSAVFPLRLSVSLSFPSCPGPLSLSVSARYAVCFRSYKTKGLKQSDTIRHFLSLLHPTFSLQLFCSEWTRVPTWTRTLHN